MILFPNSFYLGLQQFGVIPFEIRSLKIGHTEQRRTQRFYIVAIVRHRGTVGAWRNRGYLRVLLMFLSTSLQSSGLQDFLKRLFVYYQSYQQHVHYGSVALCAFGTSVILSFMLSPPCSPPLCVTFICSRLNLSLHISEEPNVYFLLLWYCFLTCFMFLLASCLSL